MAYTLRFHEAAKQEFVDAVVWYESQQTGLGKKFITDFESSLERLSANPTHYSKINKQFRQVKVENFPFTIVYEVYPRKSVIHIAAVHHTKRHPKKRLRKP